MSRFGGRGVTQKFKGLSQKLHSSQRETPNTFNMAKQTYDYFLVLDFEATCEEGSTIPKQEIIEFPVLKVDATTFDITSQFHEYVRPIHNPQLTDFCTKLTGITQEMVDRSDTFADVFGRFQQWMVDDVGLDKRFLFVTCGDWDLKSMLPGQCQLECIIIPDYFNSWLNIKKTFAHVTGNYAKGIITMLNALGIRHVGKLHSGIDDCKNIAVILTSLASTGCVFRSTSMRIPGSDVPSYPCLDSSSTCSTLPLGATNAGISGDSLYPSLDPIPHDQASCSPLYQPYDKGDQDYDNDNDGDPFGKPLDNEKKGSSLMRDDCDNEPEDEADHYGNATKNDKSTPSCPDFPAIILKLKENISSKLFNSRNRDELLPLCAAGKYLELMEEEDRRLVESRLRFYYLGLCYGWRAASRDNKALTAAAVGIDVAPQAGHSSSRHHFKKRMIQRH